jgi:hypothetical protein
MVDYTPPTFNPQYALTSLFPTVDITTDTDLLVRPGSRVLSLDFLDQGFQEILNGIRTWTTDTYHGQKWTTMCYAQQGTTSAWMFNLAFNGLDAVWQLQPGMVLRFPAISEINRVMSFQASNDTIVPVISIGAPSVVGSIEFPIPAAGITWNGLQALYPGLLTVTSNVIQVSSGFPTSLPTLTGIPWSNSGVLTLSAAGTSLLTPDWIEDVPTTQPQVANLVWLNGLIFQVSTVP